MSSRPRCLVCRCLVMCVSLCVSGVCVFVCTREGFLCQAVCLRYVCLGVGCRRGELDTVCTRCSHVCSGPVCPLDCSGLQVGGTSFSGPGEIGREFLSPFHRLRVPLKVAQTPQVDPGLRPPHLPCLAVSTWGLAFQVLFQRPRPSSQVLVQPWLFSATVTG